MIQPIRNNILAKPFPSDEISEGGIFVPETARKISNKMQVINMGKGTKQKPMQFKKRQTIYRTIDKGEEIIIDGQLHFIIPDNAILATD